MQGWLNIHKSVSVTHCVHRMENKHFMIVSRDEEKALSKTQHPILKKKKKRKLDIKENCLNIIKLTRQLTANITLNENSSVPLSPGARHRFLPAVLQVPQRARNNSSFQRKQNACQKDIYLQARVTTAKAWELTYLPTDDK